MPILTRDEAPVIETLSAFSSALETRTPQAILRWAVDTYGHALTMATAFGAEGCALLAMLSEIPGGRKVRVFNLNTGYQFHETLELRERIRDRYGIAVEFVRPVETVAELEARHGGPLYSKNPDECCRLRKIVPLRQALFGYDAWISAIRRDQTPDRAQARIVEWDKKFHLAKISPLANWTKRDVWNYILANDVPYNPLHDQGYPSIGCWPCTLAVAHGENERAGRWASFAKTECGLHAR
ncbi:MAG TPA: phosphoadenylyl-sulfate reductase [Chthonomonadaceae bacterium]|nr:phosphoadenylyl-sulfate reductase [Chthonomonadaceae bacterium]